MKTKLSIPIIIFFLFAYSSLALTSYPHIGGFFNNFALGRGIFNESLTVATSSYYVLTNSRSVPLVADLDNDGENEIVQIDGNDVLLFHAPDISVIDGFTDTNISDSNITMELFDIDGDGLIEIILSGQSQTRKAFIDILQYNNSAITLERSFAQSIVGAETMIKCGAVNACIQVISEQSDFHVGAITELRVIGFNSTGYRGVLANTTFATGSSPTEQCLPKVKNIQYEDYDGDGVTEFIFTYMIGRISAGAEDSISIEYFYLNSSGEAVFEKRIVNDDPIDFLKSTGALNCQGDNATQYFTSPFVGSIDAQDSNGLETVISVMDSANTFIMRSYRASSTALARYPSVVSAGGNIESNIMTGVAFETGSTLQFCTLGENQTSLNLLCGRQDGVTPNSREYYYNGISYNITKNSTSNAVLTHMVQESRVLTNGTDLTEIIDSYAVFSLNTSSLQMIPIYPINSFNAVVVSADVRQNGFEDIIISASTNITYLSSNPSLTGNLSCEFPRIICDTFEYTDSFNDHNWSMFQPSVGVNTTISPRNGRMQLDDLFFPEIEAQPKSPCYPQASNINICNTRNYPVNTLFFDLQLQNTNNNAKESYLKMFDESGHKGIELHFIGNNISLTTDTFLGTETNLCTDCLDQNMTSYTLTIEYKNGSNPYFYTTFGNTTRFSLFKTKQGVTSTIVSNYPISDQQMRNILNIDFTNSPSQTFKLDNILLIAGTDTAVYNAGQDTVPIYINPANTTSLGDPYSISRSINSDIMGSIVGGLDDLGIISPSSKFMIAMLGMLILAVFLVYIQTHPSIILISEIATLGFFAFIGFVPIWIIILLLLIGVGITISLFSRATSGGQ